MIETKVTISTCDRCDSHNNGGDNGGNNGGDVAQLQR
jgi:hypothetical protein